MFVDSWSLASSTGMARQRYLLSSIFLSVPAVSGRVADVHTATSLSSCAQHFIMLCHGWVTPVLYEFACYIPPKIGDCTAAGEACSPRPPFSQLHHDEASHSAV
ncbi:TPA: hypothetical protein ACH3X1_013334 [Trebouxia sp. C0004]